MPWLAGWSSGSLDSLTAEEHGLPKAQTEDWWRNFNDPVLDRLVAEAQRVNPDVRTAGMRILEARAQLMIAGSLLYPQQQQVTGNVVRTGEARSSGGTSPSRPTTAVSASGRISRPGGTSPSLPTTPV